MSRGELDRPRRLHREVDAALLALAGTLAGFTALLLSMPTVNPALVNDRLDLAIVTTATLVSVAVAGIDWARGRLAADGAALLRSSAFAVLGVVNVLTLAVLVLGVDAHFGVGLEDPGQLPIIGPLLARAAAASLLLVGGIASLRGASLPARPALAIVAPIALTALGLVALAAVQHRLPEVVPRAALGQLGVDPDVGFTPGSAPTLMVTQSLIAVAFLVAALLAHRSYRHTGRTGTVLLAAGLLVAAFSQIHGAIHPGGYSGVVTSGDLLRLGFYTLLLGAIVLDRRDDLKELRAANVEIRRLADAELATAGLAERARLAREIHDGLAQDLWYAKLKQTRLAQLVGFEDEARELSDEVGEALDAALAEARNAVAAMREGAEAGPLVEMLERHVEDFADRFALRTEFHAEGDPPEVSPRAKAEVLRILQEALTNVRKHADATTVRVSVHSDGTLRLSVTDNGRGFRPEQAPAGFGLDSMRQRAAVIGATITVASEPQNGTRVELVMRNEREGGRTDGR